MPNQDITNFTTVDHTADPDFFLRFLDEVNKLPGVIAWKSTILDALCLALYGEYPRVSVGRRENAPDPSGEAISIHDGRAILRRGAGGGYAEVDFVGQDGERSRHLVGGQPLP